MPSLNTCGDGWCKKGDWSARCVDFFLRGYRTLLTDTSPSIQIMLLAPGDPLADAEKIYWATFKKVSVYKQPLHAMHCYIFLVQLKNSFQRTLMLCQMS